MFWQYLGYCMTADTRFQKFLMVKGKGGTGKSIAISFIQTSHCLRQSHDFWEYPLILFFRFRKI